jgi:hypothetical protein
MKLQNLQQVLHVRTLEGSSVLIVSLGRRRAKWPLPPPPLSGQAKYSRGDEPISTGAERERLLGVEHTSLTSVKNLGGVFRGQGKYGAAEEMHR